MSVGAEVTKTGTSVSVGVLTAYFVVPELPVPFEATPTTPEAVVYGLLMALVAGIIAAGARSAGSLLAPYLSRSGGEGK